MAICCSSEEFSLQGINASICQVVPIYGVFGYIIAGRHILKEGCVASSSPLGLRTSMLKFTDALLASAGHHRKRAALGAPQVCVTVPFPQGLHGAVLQGKGDKVCKSMNAPAFFSFYSVAHGVQLFTICGNGLL